MGWFDDLFGGGTRIDVNTSVSRVVSDDQLPDSIKNGTIKALFDDGDLSEYLMEETVHSVANRAEQMYRYAERKYSYGMPSGEIYLAIQQRNAVEEVLKRLHGSAVTVEYSRFGPPNTLHVGWMKLVELYGYQATTNQLAKLTAEKKTPVYLKDMVVVVPAADKELYSASVLEQYGTPPTAGYTPDKPSNTSVGSLNGFTPVEISNTATEMHVEVTYCWQEKGTYVPAGFNYAIEGMVTKTAKMVVSTSGYKNKDYFQIRYTHRGVTYFFMYEWGTGLYPILDSAFDTPAQVMGEFFPFAYFRYGKNAMNGDKNSDGYKTSRKMLDYLNMDFDAVTNAVHENPGIGDVEQAMMVMAIPANSTDKLGSRYLFDFFNKMYYFLPAQFTTVNELELSQPLNDPSTSANAISIRDKLFHMILSNGGIIKKRKAGSLGAVGTYSTEVVVNTHPAVRSGGGRESTEISPAYTSTSHIYRYQVSDATYDEIIVSGLSMQYFIWGNYTTIGDENDAILLVPLDRSITSNYTMQDREDLYTRSMYFVFNSLVRTEIKWYQTAFFQALVMAVAIYVTVSTGIDATSSIYAMIAAGATATTIAITIAIGVLEFLAMQELFKLFVKAVGPEAAALIALVAAVYGTYDAISSGSVKGAPYASDLLALSSNLSTGISAELKDKMDELMSEANRFSRYIDEQEAKLDKANELLKQDNLLSPFLVFGEKPDDFYKRTVHSGNIGVMAIEMIGSFVETSLTLPKISETLEF